MDATGLFDERWAVMERGTQAADTSGSMTGWNEFPDGTRYRVLTSPADPEREPLVVELLLPPGCIAPPPHIHPHSKETFAVVEGTFEVRKGRSWHRVNAGESMTLDAGTVHTYRNRDTGPVRVRDIHEPAHSFERYIRRVGAVLEQQKSTTVTPRAAIYLAMLDREHADTVRSAPPLRVPMVLLAGLGRTLRFRLPD